MRRLFLLVGLAACSTDHVLEEPSPWLQRMVHQQRVDPYEPGSLRHPPPGTVPFEPPEDPSPPPRDRALLERGRDRYDRFCLHCHGALGRGDGPVAPNMRVVRPADLQSDRLRAAEDLRLYQVVREGYGLMPSHAHLLPPPDAWAVVAWVRVLQLSQGARLQDLPPPWQTEALRQLAPGGTP